MPISEDGPPPEDENNFSYIVDGFEFVMENGKLTIDQVEYEENEDDPIYNLARAYWRTVTRI